MCVQSSVQKEEAVALLPPPFFTWKARLIWGGVLFLLLAIPLRGADLRSILTGPYGGDVRSLVAHPTRPGVFLLGTADGQLFVSRDAGNHWSLLHPGLGLRNVVIDNLAFDPHDPNVIYAAAWELKSDRGHLFKSRNEGRDWHEIDLGPYNSSIRALAIAPGNPRVMAVGTSEGVILSQDGGTTWDRITRGYRSLHNVESLAFDPRDFRTLYVGTWRLGWKTVDLGKQWEPIHRGMIFDSDLFSLRVDPSNPQILFASACTGIYRSENAGGLWKKLRNGLPAEAKRTRTLQLDPSDPSVIYAGTTIGLFVSRNGGASWKRLLSDVVVNAVAVSPDTGNTILVGTDDAGVLKSEDRGLSFHPSNQGFTHRQISTLVRDPQNNSRFYAAVVQDRHFGGFFVFDERMLKWNNYNEGLKEAVNDIKAILPSQKSSSVFLGTSSGLFEGTPGEKPWRRLGSTGKLTIESLAFADASEEKLLLATQEGLWKFDRRSRHLQKVILSVYKGPVLSIVRDSQAGQIFAGTNIGVFRSSDGGESWQIKVKGIPYSAVGTLYAAAGHLFCGTRQGLFFSRDHGEQWQACSGAYPAEAASIQVDRERPQIVFAAGFLAGNLYESRDGGVHWRAFEAPLNGARITYLLPITAGQILVGTVSDGVYLLTSSRIARSTNGTEVLPAGSHR